MFEAVKLISFWIVFCVGVGGVIWLGLYLWDRAITYVLHTFKVKKAFIAFYTHRYGKKRPQ